MPNANHGSKLEKNENSTNPSVQVPQTGKKPGDAREDSEQQKRNREDLNVSEDHLTDKMREEKRGTFP